MSNHPDLTEAFEQAIDNHGYSGGELDRIETRACGSDNYDGVEYEFYGTYVPIRPIINTIAEVDGHAIEQMSFIDEGERTVLNVFVADIRRNQPHPAFTEEYL